MDQTTLRIKRLSPLATIPDYAHADDAGMDLCAVEDLLLAPREHTLVKTGIALAIPAGHVGLIHPRSGLAAKHGITVLNAPGTIDAGYRGEVQVILSNTSLRVFPVERGMRIAQLVLQRVEHAHVVVVDDFAEETARGERGFGSTGVSSRPTRSR